MKTGGGCLESLAGNHHLTLHSRSIDYDYRNVSAKDGCGIDKIKLFN